MSGDYYGLEAELSLNIKWSRKENDFIQSFDSFFMYQRGAGIGDSPVLLLSLRFNLW